MVPELPTRPGITRVAVVRTGQGRDPTAVAAPRAPHEAPAAAHARRDRVPVTLRRARSLAPPPRPSLRVRGNGPAVQREVPAGRVRLWPVRRQLQLAGAGVDADELPPD